MNNDIQFLKELQKQLKYEDNHDYDFQASPRFWVVMDYRTVPAHEDFADSTSYYFNDGDHTEFKNVEDLKEFIHEYYLEDLNEEEIQIYLDNDNVSFEDFWEWIIESLNEDGYFNELPVKEESFIVPNTMFLTKVEAKRHIEGNMHHYTSKAHTYAMTAWKAPTVERLLNILMNNNWDSIKEHISKQDIPSPGNFKGAFAATIIKPTEREIQYVMDHLDCIRHKEESYCSDLECNNCHEKGQVIYRFYLNEHITDVPEEYWNDKYRRLDLSICERCKSWYLTD